jgi:glycosyltransferase involved in cell wall biosynthesis
VTTDVGRRDQPHGPDPVSSTGRLSLDVLTPSFNYGRFLIEALTSVELQARLGHHIVMDGGSGDGTSELLAARSRPDLRWASEPDDGQSDALNKALEWADAEWIGWLNADEFYGPETFSTVSALLAGRDDVDILYGDCAFVDVDGRMLRLLPAHRFSTPALRDYGCFIPSCTTFVRREFLLEHQWSTDFRHSMDWHLWLRMAEAGGRFVYEPRVFAFFRVHDEQVTADPSLLDPTEFASLSTLRRQPRGRAARRLRKARGRLNHVGHKAVEGAYLRQMRAQRLRGRDMRWWLGPEQMGDVQELSRL